MDERAKDHMKLPKSVKVGWATYKIEPFPVLEAHGEAKHGDTNDLNHTIRIDTACGPARASETLLHEIFHAICGKWNLDLTKDEEERVVTSMASGLCTVWLDNPEVLAWIGKGLK